MTLKGYKKVQTIGLAKEVESLENPGSLERRVALIPADVNFVKG